MRGVLTTLDELAKQFHADLRKRTENRVDDPLVMKFSRSSNLTDQSTLELNGEFVYNQLLIDCLVRLKSNANEKSELASWCAKIYQNDPSETKTIKEFEQNYLSHRAIWWYTRESCFYRLLNKALRVQNIDALFLFRFFIRDMDQQLRQFQYSAAVRVYRGQLISADELTRLKNSMGQFISINSFFSTSLDRSVAMTFLHSYSFATDTQKVLFEIDANPSSGTTAPFSHINSTSYYSNEQEILFMLGAIFRLNTIEQDNSGVWLIRMSLTGQSDQTLNALFETVKREYNGISEETNLLSLGNLLYQTGKYDLAEKYYQRLLKDLPAGHADLSRCYHALGMIALVKEQYDSSLQYQEKSLALLQPSDPRLAETYNCIGCVHQKKADNVRAVEFYQKALTIWMKTYGEDYYQIADCLNNMGCIHETEQNYAKALQCHEKALAIRQKNLPNDHRDLAASYNNIGNIRLCLEEYDAALGNYQAALTIKKKTLPSQHPSIASTLENIGLVYENKEELYSALGYFREAASIFEETFSPNHAHVINIKEDIARVSNLLVAVPGLTLFWK